ncbi:flagellar biosynthesis anti-sigma factor FlgM [Fictibacillus nanhaiensis]|uniref:flagellar biosynthesis anti-sigma factor FlgM n=1 Tax=Fictibacillus nanhaiensis TaxID=742169 RepID=UPI00203D77BB|nr:flagellar biosynthesis anti-sigma factor FlgM [Fictibacillus nanhaiensis]MCM3731590.1 flagellar biosynthesis anti-sigma factor FlgM [Fictibacillus nanhaiensis]
MRINHFNSIQNNPYKNQVQDMKQEKMQSNFKKDELQISDEAKKLLSSSKFDQERAEKISEIKNQVDKGTYKVNVSETAKSIINFWQK